MTCDLYFFLKDSKMPWSRGWITEMQFGEKKTIGVY